MIFANSNSAGGQEFVGLWSDKLLMQNRLQENGGIGP
jgi:hypothetical protein